MTLALALSYQDSSNLQHLSCKFDFCKLYTYVFFQVLKMLVVVVVLFVTSWLPVYAIQIRIYFGSPLDPSSMEFYWLTQVRFFWIFGQPMTKLGFHAQQHRLQMIAIYYCFLSRFSFIYTVNLHPRKTSHQQTVYLTFLPAEMFLEQKLLAS